MFYSRIVRSGVRWSSEERRLCRRDGCHCAGGSDRPRLARHAVRLELCEAVGEQIPRQHTADICVRPPNLRPMAHDPSSPPKFLVPAETGTGNFARVPCILVPDFFGTRNLGGVGQCSVYHQKRFYTAGFSSNATHATQ